MPARGVASVPAHALVRRAPRCVRLPARTAPLHRERAWEPEVWRPWFLPGLVRLPPELRPQGEDRDREPGHHAGRFPAPVTGPRCRGANRAGAFAGRSAVVQAGPRPRWR